ncbi:MAG: SDH family Clp fold serine proteinase [Candidatus Rokuibacteriota bacterium]
MVGWNQIRKELEARPRTPQNTIDHDGFRRGKYTAVEKLTGRPLIVYATDFLHKAKLEACRGDVEIDLTDRDGFIEVTQNLKDESVDVMIYSPGGLPEAADSIVNIIRNKFKHARYIVPAIAKSAATMVALSGDECMMEQNAELGPIDPQFRFFRADGAVMAPAQAIIDQFEMAQKLVGNDPQKLVAWMPIIQQYGPSLYQQCLNAIELSKRYVSEWLKTGMFKQLPEAEREARVKTIVDYLADHNEFKSHGARVGVKELQDHSVPVKVLNDDAVLTDAVMSVYHAVSLTFAGTGAYRLIENSRDDAFIRLIAMQEFQVVPGGPHRGLGGGKKKR